MNLPSFQNCLSLLPRMLGHSLSFVFFLFFFVCISSYRKDRVPEVRARFLPNRSEDKRAFFGLHSNMDWQ